MYPRLLHSRLLDALDDSPVVFLSGPRQAGKTTLALQVAEARGMAYRTLDDPTELAAASADPAAYVDALPFPAVLDEAQRAPGLFLPLKALVDRERRSGSLLLTGSANVFFLPQVADSLAGRMQILTLFPLTQAELQGGRGRFLEALWRGEFSETPPPVEIETRVLRGGFPPALDARRPEAWFASYVEALLTRDVRDLARVERLFELPNLLALLAARSGGLLNHSALSRESGLPATTLRRYLALFKALYLVWELPAWSANLGKRLLKSPKLYLSDTGLMGYLLGVGEGRLVGPLWGQLMEAFVVNEIARLLAAGAGPRLKAYHLRDDRGLEVDLVLEAPSGEVVALEIKASKTLSPADFRGLGRIREVLGDRFRLGGVLYPGENVVPFGDDLWALPISLLWL